MFDVISDLHADFYLKNGRISLSISDFIHYLLPEKPSPVLIIAGDISNDNRTSEDVLRELSKYYSHILIVFGNHDLYIENNPKLLKEQTELNQPLYRWIELKKALADNSKIVFLDGSTFEYEGIIFGGTGGWYDLSYSLQKLNVPLYTMESAYKSGMNDSKCIPGMKKFNWEFTNKEKDKVDSLIEKVDVMITHVPPTAERISGMYQRDKLSGCFFFDGEDFLSRTTAKVWICGHTHSQFDFNHKGVRIINPSLGYPFEAKPMGELIKTISI